jgi:hypothetical protein
MGTDPMPSQWVINQQLDEARNSLGYPPFKHPQQSVCVAALSSDDDNIFVAPCGFGKSACFTIPGVISGGMTLVIEPFNAQIESQLESLRWMEPIQVEKLLRYNGVSGNCLVEDMPAASRLQYLAKNFSKGKNPKPMIIFGTVESW